jgi:hypothetical protein
MCAVRACCWRQLIVVYALVPAMAGVVAMSLSEQLLRRLWLEMCDAKREAQHAKDEAEHAHAQAAADREHVRALEELRRDMLVACHRRARVTQPVSRRSATRCVVGQSMKGLPLEPPM